MSVSPGSSDAAPDAARGRRRDRLGSGSLARSVVGAIGASWLTMVAGILVMANEVAIPLDFVVRPAAIALMPAALIGLVSVAFGRVRLLAAVCLSTVALIPALWPWAFGLAVIELAVWISGRARSRRVSIGRFSVLAMIVLLGVSTVRLLPSIGDYLPDTGEAEDSVAHPVYLLLMDGYPRLDSLRELGIDNAAFVAELEQRGFDHYPDATSAHQWTHRTLQALVAGSPAGIPDEPGTNTQEQEIRSSLQLPAGFLAIDPPASHVVMRGGRNASAGGMNDFEIRLVGTSAVGRLARDWAAGMVAASLRHHFERSLDLVATTDAAGVFAHVLMPHPPFIYADGLSDCWPGCNIFDVSTDKLDISVDEWADQMSTQLAASNQRVLATIDRVLATHPDAVIVLFSDHGGRYDVESDEVHHSFLAARTPDHPKLFASEPHPHAILRRITGAYP